MSPDDWRKSASIDDLLEDIDDGYAEPRKNYIDAPSVLERQASAAENAIYNLAEVVRRQQAQIAALERPSWPTGGLPLEGTRPLPLETREQ